MMRPYIFSFRIQGVVVRAEPSWLFLALLVGWSLASGFFPGLEQSFTGTTYIVMAVAGVVGLTFSIIAHELSHTFVGRAFGMPINHVTLFLFGGAAELEAEPTDAYQELLMALAGPAMSVVLSVVFGLAAGLVTTGTEVTPVALVLSYLSLINLILAIFNMLPAFPLDGGRVLRATIWMFNKDQLAATRLASRAGEAFGIFFMVTGAFVLLGAGSIAGAWWVLIGFFLRNAAVASREQMETRRALAGVQVGDLVSPAFETADADLSVADFIRSKLVMHHCDWLPVVRSNGELVGGAGVENVQAVDADSRSSTPVGEIAAAPREIEIVAPSDGADAAFLRLQRQHLDRLYVVDRGRLMGVLALSDLTAYARMHTLFSDARFQESGR